MTNSKYIGMDVHKESNSIAVRNAAGKIGTQATVQRKLCVGSVAVYRATVRSISLGSGLGSAAHGFLDGEGRYRPILRKA